MKKLLSILLFLSLALSLAGCGSGSPASGSAVGKFEKQVKENQYLDAAQTYADGVLGNAQKELEVKDFLSELLNSAWDKYLAETISKNDFEIVLQTLAGLDQKINVMGWTLKEIQAEFPEVAASKEAYHKGVEQMKNEEYEAAMQSFSMVDPSDSLNYAAAQDRYEEAEDQYVKAVIDSAQGYADAGQIDIAETLIYEAENLVGERDELETFLQNAYTGYYADKLAQAFSAKDYLTVVRIYQEAKASSYTQISADMTDKYSQSVSEYLLAVGQEAEKAFLNGKDYTAAIGVIRAAISEASDLEEMVLKLEGMAEEYKAYIPVSLFDVDCIQRKSYISIGSGRADDARDANGTSYDENRILRPSGGSLNGDVSDSEDDSYIVYNLNFQYSHFTATLYRPYSSLSATKGWDTKTTVKIYADGVLLYEAPNFNQDTYDPVEVSLDVSGVRNLKIVMRGVLQYSTGDFGLYDYRPKVCLANAFLQK